MWQLGEKKKPICESLHVFPRSLLPQQTRTYRTHRLTSYVPYISKCYNEFLLELFFLHRHPHRYWYHTIPALLVSYLGMLLLLLQLLKKSMMHSSSLPLKAKTLWYLQFSPWFWGRFLIREFSISWSSWKLKLGFVNSLVMEKCQC